MTTRERLFFREHTHEGMTGGGVITGTVGNFTVGSDRVDGTDYRITFGGYNNDGILAWMEDEDRLQSYDDLMMSSTERIYFRDTALGIYSYADGYLDLFADTDVRINNYPVRPIPVGGLYLNITGNDPNGELGYGTWTEETDMAVNLWYLTLGNGESGSNTYLTFKGYTGDGVFEWIDVEQQFRIYDPLLMYYPASIMFSDSHSYIDDDGAYMRIVTDSDLRVTCGGTIELQNPVYEDIRINAGSFDRPGASDPAFVAVTPGGSGTTTYLLEFQLNDIASFTVQIPHAYQTGQDIKVHVHWTPGSRGNEESGNLVGWKVDYSWANILGAFGSMTTADLSDECNGVDWEHNMTQEVTITGTDKGISSMLICNIKRTKAASEDTWVGTAAGQLPLLLEIDFHFPIDTMGSRSWSSK